MAQKADLIVKETPAELEDLYRQMLFIRHFEEKCNLAYRTGKAGGYLHVYIGMEATAVGWLNSIRKGYDDVIAAYRIHALPLILGTDPVKCMAEIMGRVDGTSRGKGGSMHIYDPERRFWGGWGIVGGHNPIGAGLAFASKYRKEDRITLCFLGDGAANAGAFFESLNMASLWDLPVIFIIENNEYAMGTALERHASDPELWKRGLPFNMKCERLDGMDVIQVRKDAQRIVDWVRANQKPYLVEVMNYRFAGHGAADNDQTLYRTVQEVEEHKAHDPIKRLEAIFREKNLMTDEKMEAIDAELADQVEKIYEQADASPHPTTDEVYLHVYTDIEPEKGH